MTEFRMRMQNKRLILGVTGGIAAYKAAELARLLTQADVQVQTVMTQSACQFIGTTTFQSLTGNHVYTDLWQTNAAQNMAHINLSRQADMLVIAPASADFIAKIANGLADDLLSTLCLARDCPLMVAPAMNRQMWENPATQRNIARVKQDGIKVVGPVSGVQACGETGMGRMLEAGELLEIVQAELFSTKQLQGLNVLITAGSTYEAIDAVRGITNRSSGKMGYAIARAAVEAGAKVSLVSGPSCQAVPAVEKLIRVDSAQEMLQAVQSEVDHSDIFIGVAAVADYRVANASSHKLKRSSSKLTLELVPNTDILHTVASLPEPPFCVGFAAETEDLEENARLKRASKNIPLLVANLAQHAIGADASELVLIDETGQHVLPMAAKIEQARHLISHIGSMYRQFHFQKPHTHDKN